MFENFKKLPANKRALLAVALLIDGREAVDILGADEHDGQLYRAITTEFGSLDPELRVAFMSTMLREALDTLEKGEA